MPVDTPFCSSCRAAVPADARFCPQCGTRLGALTQTYPTEETAPSPPAERRPVAVLFADLSGYTQLSRLDPEEVHRLLTRSSTGLTR